MKLLARRCHDTQALLMTIGVFSCARERGNAIRLQSAIAKAAESETLGTVSFLTGSSSGLPRTSSVNVWIALPT
jgi:hypothetical protein